MAFVRSVHFLVTALFLLRNQNVGGATTGGQSISNQTDVIMFGNMDIVVNLVQNTQERVELQLETVGAAVLTPNSFKIELLGAKKSRQYSYKLSKPTIPSLHKALKATKVWMSTAYAFAIDELTESSGAVLLQQEQRRLDNPGCDWWPDNSCDLGCCAVHDQCYLQNGCTASSWTSPTATAACVQCNAEAVTCMFNDCPAEICFDNVCNIFYDCPGQCDFFDMSDAACCGCQEAGWACDDDLRIELSGPERIPCGASRSFDISFLGGTFDETGTRRGFEWVVFDEDFGFDERLARGTTLPIAGLNGSPLTFPSDSFLVTCNSDCEVEKTEGEDQAVIYVEGGGMKSNRVRVECVLGLNEIRLAGPRKIPCGGKKTYEIDFLGFFDKTTMPAVNWNAYDEDDSVFDPVDDRLAFGEAPAVSGRVRDPLTYPTQTFEVKCNKKCMILGTDGEESATLYATEDSKDLESNRIQVRCVKEGKGGGEPHFKTWTNHKYDYHGECDLVLLQSPTFASGLGLTFHIRTKIKRHFSFITNAALRIGSDLLEVSTNGVHYLNGRGAANLDHGVSGFPVTYTHSDAKTHMWYVNLGKRGNIVIRDFKGFLYVQVEAGDSDDFIDSVGLMGSFKTGAMLARDGQTILNNPNEFGQEWQVLSTEPKLFHTIEGPQQPHEVCNMPSSLVKGSRRLQASKVSEAQAEAACSRWGDAKDDCMFDVMAMDDLEMARAGEYLG